MELFYSLLISATIILVLIHFIFGKYFTPYFKKKQLVSMKRYDGKSTDVKCWFDKGLGKFLYKEYDTTYILSPRGESNGYFNESWIPLDSTMVEYFNSGPELSNFVKDL